MLRATPEKTNAIDDIVFWDGYEAFTCIDCECYLEGSRVGSESRKKNHRLSLQVSTRLPTLGDPPVPRASLPGKNGSRSRMDTDVALNGAETVGFLDHHAWLCDDAEFFCAFCPDRFSTVAEKESHMDALHLFCDHCEVWVKDDASMDRHLWFVHGLSRYACPTCGLCFQGRKDLAAHGLGCPLRVGDEGGGLDDSTMTVQGVDSMVRVTDSPLKPPVQKCRHTFATTSDTSSIPLPCPDKNKYPM